MKQDKQRNLPGGDWRDAVVVGWTLVLTVAGEKDVVDDGKIKKIRAVVEYRWLIVGPWSCGRLRERD